MTPDDRFVELWTDYLEGDLGEAGLAELQTLLASDEHLRNRAADLFQAHRLLGFALQDYPTVGEAFVRATVAAVPPADEVFVASVMTHLPTPSADLSPRRMFARTLAVLALGLLVGVVVTSAAWAYSVPRQHERPGASVVILDDGYETGPAPRVAGILSEPDVWGGDFSRVTGPLQGVTPANGVSMLQVLRADYLGKPTPDGSYCGDLYRLIDLKPYRRDLAEGTAVVQLSAVFNAVEFPAAEQYGGSLSIHALTTEIAANPSGASTPGGALAMARNSRLRLDRDPSTWQRVETELRLPADADFLLIHLGVNHVPRFQKRATFDGHFVDDVRVTLGRRRPLP